MGLLAWLVAVFLLQGVNPPACQWTHPVEIGTVEAPIDEDSGLAVSRAYPGRVYHVNDSGDSGRFFTTDMAGRNVRVISVAGFKPQDAEDLALGPCGGPSDCLFIGDIGDNSRRRRTAEIVVIEEKETFGPVVQPKYRLQIRYPDQPRNAEALAVHPNGDIFILTKGGIPTLYRLKKDLWMNAKEDVQTLELVIPIDLEKLGGPEAAFDGRLPTGMDISPDGKRLIIITYRNVFELFFDLSQPLPDVATWKPGQHYRRIDIEVLEQEEAIAYTPDGRSFIYDTEQAPKVRARIMKSDCR